MLREWWEVCCQYIVQKVGGSPTNAKIGVSGPEFGKSNDDWQPHVPSTLFAYRVQRLPGVVVRGVRVTQRSAKPCPAPRGRKTHTRALGSGGDIRCGMPKSRQAAAPPDFWFRESFSAFRDTGHNILARQGCRPHRRRGRRGWCATPPVSPPEREDRARRVC